MPLIGRRGIRAGLQFGDEPKPVPVDRSDHGLIAPVISNRLARGLDRRRERTVGDEPPLPDRLDQLFLGDNPVLVRDQHRQGIKGLGLHGDRGLASPQLARVVIYFIVAKRNPHSILPAPRRIVANREPIGNSQACPRIKSAPCP